VLLLVVAVALLTAWLWLRSGGQAGLEAGGAAAPSPEAAPDGPAPLPGVEPGAGTLPSSPAAPTDVAASDSGVAEPGPEASGEEADSSTGGIRLTMTQAGVPIDDPSDWTFVMIPHDAPKDSEPRSFDGLGGGFKPGRWTLWMVTTYTMRDPVVRDVVIVAGRQTEVAVEVPAPRQVEFRFLGRDGEPVPGLKVSVSVKFPDAPKGPPDWGIAVGGGWGAGRFGVQKHQATQSWSLDAEGQSVRYLAAADGTLRFTSASRAPVAITVTFAGREVLSKSFPGDVSREDVVLDVGAPALTLELPPCSRWTGWRVVVANEQGVVHDFAQKLRSIAVRDLEPGSYVLRLSGGRRGEGFAGRIRVTGAPQTLRPAVQRDAHAACDVVDASTGEGIESPRVRWRFDGVSFDGRWGLLDAEAARSRKTQLPSGVPLDVEIVAPGYAPWKRAVHLQPGELRDLGEISLTPQR
jgi:hypothetical protein